MFRKGGQIVDGTLVEVPKQRFSKEEKEAIEAGKSAREIWAKEPNKTVQKDADARWVSRLKGWAGHGSGGNSGRQIVVSRFGYNLCVSIDNEHKIVRRFAVFSANVHDSQTLRYIVHFNNEDRRVLEDSALPSKKNKKFLEENSLTDEVIERKSKGKKMSEETARLNSRKEKERSRVEHVFGHMNYCRGSSIRTIGLVRAEAKLSLAVLVYNIDRFTFLKRQQCTVG